MDVESDQFEPLITVILSEDIDYDPSTYEIFNIQESRRVVDNYFLGLISYLEHVLFKITDKMGKVIRRFLAVGDPRVIALVELWWLKLIDLEELVDTFFIIVTCTYDKGRSEVSKFWTLTKTRRPYLRSSGGPTSSTGRF